MGNCLVSSARVDTAQTSHITSGASKTASKTSRSSAPSSLTTLSYSDTSNAESLPTPRSEGEILSSSNMKAFLFNELKNATRNFRPDSLLGEGGFGYVFKGWIDEQTFAATKPGSGMVVAVKKLKPEGFQGHKEWLTEVNYLGQLHHPNLVKLIGYCSDGDNRLLVYEFMPKGSLENHLFRRGPQPLSWAVRIKVAIGAARGLSFLHDAKSQVIYRDFKASNILLDADFNAKLSDFGLAKAGPTGDRTHVSTQVMGTHGYAAPEYVATGRLTEKSDVYSFGVVLLELLSGRRAVDKSKVGVEQNLVDWAKPYLGDKRKLFRIMDTKLEAQYPQKGAYTASTLALQCLSAEAKARPRMADVLATLEQLEAPKIAAKHSPYEQQTISSPVQKSPLREVVGPIPNSSSDEGVVKVRTDRKTKKTSLDPPSEHDEAASFVSEEELPGIEGFRIIGGAVPGDSLFGCGYPVRGTSFCLFQWVRHLPDGTKQYIGGATNPEYVATVDDVDKLIAVECIPMDDNSRQGELVTAFANDRNKITCDPNMQMEIDTYISKGQAMFSIQLLMESSENWESTTLMLRQSSYLIKISRTEALLTAEKFSKELSIKIPSGLSTQFLLTCSNGDLYPFRTYSVRMRDTLVLTMRMFQNKALDDRRKGKA